MRWTVRVYYLAVPRRLTELAAVLALAADTGHGAPYEHQLRATVLAGRIVEARRAGRFTAVDDLRKVKGIGAKTLEKVRPFAKVTDR